MDIKLRAILSESARTLVRVERGGQGGNYTFPKLGLTAVSIDQGQISSMIPWMIHGAEAVISGDIAEFVSSFELIAYGLNEGDIGHYVLRNRSRQILAEAKVEEWASTKREFYIHGKRREDVVKLFEMIRNGETAPESDGGRRGLIRGLRQALESVTQTAKDLAFQVGTCEGREQVLSEYRSNLEQQIVELRTENAELKKVKKLTPWQFFWRLFFGTNDPQVA
jgi:hypothetical protein